MQSTAEDCNRITVRSQIKRGIDMEKSNRALELFQNNFNCSQAVLTAFASDYGISEELALKIGTSFGGGARNGEICGAVSGALMVIGLKYGHYHAEDIVEKQRAYKIAVDYTTRFRNVNGAIVCRDLLGYDLTIPSEMECIKEKGLFKDICAKMIRSAVEILEEILEEYHLDTV